MENDVDWVVQERESENIFPSSVNQRITFLFLRHSTNIEGVCSRIVFKNHPFQFRNRFRVLPKGGKPSPWCSVTVLFRVRGRTKTSRVLYLHLGCHCSDCETRGKKKGEVSTVPNLVKYYLLMLRKSLIKLTLQFLDPPLPKKSWSWVFSSLQ